MNLRALLLVLAAICLVSVPQLQRDRLSLPATPATPPPIAASAPATAVARPIALAPAAPLVSPETRVTPAGSAHATHLTHEAHATHVSASANPPLSAPPASVFFGDNGPVDLTEIPAGPFRTSLEVLSPSDRSIALAHLARIRVPRSQTNTLRATALGGLLHVCPVHAGSALSDESEAETAPEPAAFTSAASVPISNPPALSSKPGATRALYLDFNGHVVSNTAWNIDYSRGRFDALPYDIDGDRATFSDAEQEIIREVWSRVAEDFAAFDINVTTVEPAPSPLVGRALITHALDANGQFVPGGSNAGGVAYLGVYGISGYDTFRSPAWVIADNVGETSAANIAEVTSHEFGHNLGLSHDGAAGRTYYPGHGSGATSWGPIMGAAYGRNVTTFNPGDYAGANNPQDDLATISINIPYRADVVGESISNAVNLGAQGSVTQGRIERSTDADLFKLTTASGVISVQITTFAAASDTRGNNLDIGVELLDSSGGFLSRHDATNSPDVTLNTVVTPGTYYLRLTADDTGHSAPYSTGYSNYGSIGTYSITNNTSPSPPPLIFQQPTGAALPLGSSHTFTVVADGTATSYQWRLNGAPISGATGSSLTLSNLTFTRAGTYTCVVANSAAGIVSQPAQLGVYRATGQTITVNPSSNTLFPTLLAGAFDDLIWSRGGQTINRDDDPRVIPSGASLRINGVKAEDAGTYTLSASFDGQPIAIGPVTVNVRPPVVVSTPESVTVYRGSVPVVPITASHSGLTYRYTGLPPGIGYQPNGLLTLGTIGAAPATYSVTVSGTDVNGNTGSTNFLLIVQARPVQVTVPPQLRAYTLSVPPLDVQSDATIFTYAYTGLPVGATYHATTGRITFPRAVAPGTYPITVTVGDAYSNTGSATFALEVSSLPAERIRPYAGVVERHPSLNLSLGGKLTLTPVLSKGVMTSSYTGVLSLGAVNYAVSGRISTGGPDTDLSLALVATVNGRQPLNLAITLPLDPSAPASGTVTASVGTPAAITAWTTPYGKTVPATAYVGKHAFALFPPEEESSTAPAGVGLGTLAVTAVGKASWTATLADGTRVTGSTALGASGEVLIFTLAPAPGGSVLGSLSLSAPDRAIGGSLTWLRARATAKAYPTALLYRDGFGPLALTALGGPLSAPTSVNRVLGRTADASGVRLVFSSGGLTETQLAQLALPALSVTAKNTAAVPTGVAANPATLRLALKASQNTFSGSFSFKDPNPLKTGAFVTRKASFAGVVIGQQGVGYFLFPGIKTTADAPAATLSGLVTLEPLPAAE